MTRLGGVADTRRLVALTSRRKVATAVQAGRVVRDSRGRLGCRRRTMRDERRTA